MHTADPRDVEHAPDPASAGERPHYTAAEKRKRIFAIMAASSGNLVEWFDFYVYAFCAVYFAPAFFPKSDPTAQLLNTAGVFAAGFLMRPIGGWLFGRIADRRGSREAGSILGLWRNHRSAFLIVVGGTAEYVALGLKSLGHEPLFYWYVSAMMVVVFLVGLKLPKQPTYLHSDH